MKPDAMDRYTPLFAPPDGAFDGFLRRRDRKRRNQKIGALLLALIIMAGSIAAAVAAFHGSSEPKPVGVIDPGNVTQLHQIANDVTFPQEGFRMATGDGVLVVGTSAFRGQRAELIAYPYPCGDAASPCVPLWRAGLDGAASPVVADGVVYATGLHGRTLYAFATDCGSNGAPCSPRWTADVGPTGSITPPLVVDDGSSTRVFVGTADAVLGFDVGCDRGTCRAVWNAPMSRPVRSIAYGDGALFVGTGKPGAPDPANTGSVTAFGLGPPCPHTPAGCRSWSRNVGQVWDLAVDGGRLFVGTNGGSTGVQAYSTDCVAGTGSCRLLWTGATTCCTQLTAANGTIDAEDQTAHAYAFSESCASNGSACHPLWTSSEILGQPFLGFPRPLVVGGLAFVGGDEGWIYAFRGDCVDACPPANRTFIPDQHGGPGIWDAVALDDRLYVAAADGLHVFSTEAAPRATTAASTGDAPLFYGGIAIVAGIVLGVGAVRRRRLGSVFKA